MPNNSTTNFPAALDVVDQNPSSADRSDAAMLAVQTKLGVDGSTDTNSLEHRVERSRETLYAADGAITIQSGTAVITKASAAAMTLAAPTSAQKGTTLTIVAGTAFAHVVTATGLIDDGTENGPLDEITLEPFVGACVTLRAYNLKWVLVSKNVSSGGGGASRLVDLTDIDYGLSEPIGADDVILCYTTSAGPGSDEARFTNIPLGETIINNLNILTPGIIDTERAVMSNIAAASDEADALTKFNSLLTALKAGGYMTPD